MKEILRSVVLGFQEHPIILGLMVLNLMFFGGLVFLLLKQGEARQQALEILLKGCLDGRRF